ncbi:MAG: hypothetical protein HUK15_00760, partial [Bacteroidales bacterium]|nr:hypothetical protein [Bacteroidales bacterium]
MRFVNYFMMKNLLSKRVIIGAIIVFVATLCAFVFTMPQFSSSLYTADLTLSLDIPSNINMDNKFVTKLSGNKMLRDTTLSVFEGSTGLCKLNYSERVKITTGGYRNVLLVVRDENAENALTMIDFISEQMNDIIASIISVANTEQFEEQNNLMLEKRQQIDSLKKEILEIENRVANSISPSMKNNFEYQRFVLEKDPDYIFAIKMLEKYADDLGFCENNIQKLTRDNILNHIYLKRIS